jgi:signal transduction histidine kinase
LQGAAQLEGEQQALIERHVASRLRHGSTLSDMLTEFAVLGRCITWFLDREPEASRPSAAEAARVLSELHLTCLGVRKIFSDNMLEDEQTMKRHVRRLHELDGARIDGPGGATEDVAGQSLELIVRALDADTGALRLFHGSSNERVLFASVGDAGEALEDYLRSLDPAGLAGAAPDGEAVTMADVDLLNLEGSQRLRRVGIRSLLGVRLAAHHAMRGVICVGLRERRAFTSSEVRLLESLGEALTVQLDHAELSAALRTRANEATSEGRLRERFVSLLAHDLTGPLAAARSRAVALLDRASPHAAATVDELIADLDRVGEMVHSLLDARHIRAGRRIPMAIERCDLAALVRSTAAELRLVHGDRFAVQVDRGVSGMWCADQLRRALWNLAENAIRFGAAGAPVLIQVRRRADGVEMSVHNHGGALSREEQAELFAPFAPPRASQGDPPGWGLGLTLVWGCAEAHGGEVTVVSEPGQGTTITLAIPEDARPYADQGSSSERAWIWQPSSKSIPRPATRSS